MIFGIAAILILVMIFIGVAVPLSFLGGSFFVAFMGLGSTGTFATNAFYVLNSISMLAIPLFIVGGSLIERSGIANVLIRVADKMLHNVKGGLSATIPVVSCFLERCAVRRWQRRIRCRRPWCRSWRKKDTTRHIWLH